MTRLLTGNGRNVLEGHTIYVLCPNPIAALDVAEQLEFAGAKAPAIFDLHQLSFALRGGLPDGAIAELDEHSRWTSAAIALLHELNVPQVVGVTERQRHLLRPRMPKAMFLPAPLDPAYAVMSLGIVLNSHWPRMLRQAGFARRWSRSSAAPGRTNAAGRATSLAHPAGISPRRPAQDRRG